MQMLENITTSEQSTNNNRCPVHGCKTGVEPSVGETLTLHESADCSVTVQFPASYEVCKTSIDSSLASYNP